MLKNSTINKCSLAAIVTFHKTRLIKYLIFQSEIFLFSNTAQIAEEKQKYFWFVLKRSLDMLLMRQCNLFVGHERSFSFPLAINSLPPSLQLCSWGTLREALAWGANWRGLPASGQIPLALCHSFSPAPFHQSWLTDVSGEEIKPRWTRHSYRVSEF